MTQIGGACSPHQQEGGVKCRECNGNGTSGGKTRVCHRGMVMSITMVTATVREREGIMVALINSHSSVFYHNGARVPVPDSPRPLFESAFSLAR